MEWLTNILTSSNAIPIIIIVVLLVIIIAILAKKGQLRRSKVIRGVYQLRLPNPMFYIYVIGFMSPL